MPDIERRSALSHRTGVEKAEVVSADRFNRIKRKVGHLDADAGSNLNAD
jgi:hypothetical protein